MGKIRWTLAFAAFAGLAIAGTAADARKGSSFGSTYEELHLVQPLKDQGADRSLSLCHLVKTHSVFFVPVWTTMQGYALAENRCETDRFRLVSADDLTFLKGKGAIDIATPDMPALSARLSMRNWFVVAVLGGGLGLALFGSAAKAIGGRRRKKLRQAKLGQISPLAHQTLDAMCHLAKVDGHVDQGEVALIAGIAERLTGTPVSPTAIHEMIDSANPKHLDYRQFGKGLSAGDRSIVMRGVVMTAYADFNFQDEEMGFIARLAQALAISTHELELLIGEVAAEG